MSETALQSPFDSAARWPGPPDQILRANPAARLPDPDAALRRALHEPLGCEPLPALAARARRVAVVLPDSTRPLTPWPAMLAAVLDVLFAAGRRPDDVVLVIGNGMHPLRGAAGIGLDATRRRGCRVLDHDACDRAGLVRIGRIPALGLRFFLSALARLARDLGRHAPASAVELVRALRRADADALRSAWNRAPWLRPVLALLAASGAPVRVSRAVAEADLVIGLSRVKPHPLTGYSGGAKSIYPAAGDRLGVGRNHLIQLHRATRPGEVEANLLRRGIEQAVALLPSPFVVNAVTDADGRWCGVTAGAPVTSHRAVLPAARRIAEVPARPTDVVLFSNSEQAGLDLFQFSKSFLAPGRILRPGGVAIGIARLPLGAVGAGAQGVSAAFGQGIYYTLGIRPLLAAGVRFYLAAPDAPAIARGTPYRGFPTPEQAFAAACRGRSRVHLTHVPDLDSVLPLLGRGEGARGRCRPIPRARTTAVPGGQLR